MSSSFQEARNYLLHRGKNSERAQRCLRLLEEYRTRNIYLQKWVHQKQQEEARAAAAVTASAATAAAPALHGDLMELWGSLKALER